MTRRYRFIRGRAAKAGLFLSASLFAYSGQQALAQDASDTSSSTAQQVPVITVTAEFQTMNIQNTPIAITALTGSMLESQGISNVTQISAPNVNISAGADAFGPSSAIYIRGVGQYDTNPAYEPGVGVYIDDVYYGILLGSNIELMDLDRVEILRGPQGTTSGKNSLGGSVKLYSIKPTGDSGGYVEAGVGDYNRIDVRGAYDWTLADNLFLRVTGMSHRVDGYMKLLDYACVNPAAAADGLPIISNGNGCQTGEEGGENVIGVRAALRWLPTDKIEVNIIADKTEDDSEAPATTLYYANGAPFGGPAVTYPGTSVAYGPAFVPSNPYVSYATYTDPSTGWKLDPISHVSSWGVSGDADWALTDHFSIRSITAYRESDSTYNYDQDNSPLNIALAHVHTPYHQLTQELRFSGDLFDRFLDWTVGGFYFDSHAVLENRLLSPPVLNTVTHDPVDSTSKSAFGQAIFHITSKLNLTGGIRYTQDDKHYLFDRTFPDGTVDPSLSGTVGQYSGSRIDYRAVIDYRWNDSFMTYAQYSTGYKGGGTNPKPFVAAQVVPYGPETVDAYEIGFKSDLFERKARIDVAAFWNKYNSIILINANGAQGFPLSAEPFNAGNADIKGIELEGDFRPLAGLSINTSVSYLDFKYSTLSADAIASSITLNNVPPLTPEWQASGEIAYDFSLGDLGTLTPRFDVKYVSDEYSDPANSNFDVITTPGFMLLPAHTVVNAGLTYKTLDSKWQASLEVTNLTDKVYYTNAFAFWQSGTGQKSIAAPREISFKVRRRFG